MDRLKTHREKGIQEPSKSIKKEMPRKIRPMLAFITNEPFDSEEWVFEVKWDGYRGIAEVEDQQVVLYSRTLHSYNSRFPSIIEGLQELHVNAVFDGEIVALDDQGKPQFQFLQNDNQIGEGNLFYYIFDLLYYEGEDLRSLPLLKRKQILETVLSSSKHPAIRFSRHIIGQGRAFFMAIAQQKLEGMMAKEAVSPYSSTRSHSWLKVKVKEKIEAVICGFTSPKGSRKEIGALILGLDHHGEWAYIGHVGGGFNEKSLVEIKKKLTPLITDHSPFLSPPKTNTSVTWVTPRIKCEVTFSEWTQEGMMRHPIFLGLLEISEKKKESHSRVLPPRQAKDLSLTHLNKLFWPKEGITKGDLIAYYEKIAPFLLPYLKNRPQTLRRYPNGIEEEGFFQKNIDDAFPSWVPSVEISHESKTIKYMLIQDVRCLLFAVNLGCIDFNPFFSRISHLEQPDYLVLDLDPIDISFESVVEVAQEIHEILDSMAVPNYCKTSGARGLHIYVPLHTHYSFDQAKEFAQEVAQLCHARLPKTTSLERRPAMRQKKVYLDYLQNRLKQTMVAPYSVRPKPGAPVSTPLEWSEVKKGLDPIHFSMKTIFSRLQEKGDLFSPIRRIHDRKKT